MTGDQHAGVLTGKKILVLEDEYFLADDVRRALVKAGADVVGPFADIAEGLEAIASHPDLSSAALDINLRNEVVSPVAQALRDRGIPFVLTTGYDQNALPPGFETTPRCEKPVDPNDLVRLLVNA